MSSEVSLLHRDSKSTPTTVIPLQYEESTADRADPTTHEERRPSWIKRCWRDVVSDLRSASWKEFGKGYVLGVWVFCLVILATTLPLCLYLIGMGASVDLTFIGDSGLGPSGCLPNDAFSARSIPYNIFDPSGLFQITHGFGTLTFTQAKVIDLIWDIGVGRVGQTILAYYSWKTFTAYFTVAMGAKSVTYSTFWAIFLDRQPSLLSISRIIRDFIKQQTGRSKSAIIFIPFSMSFVLAFPTLMSAMTGYRPNSAAFVADSVNSLVPFEKFTMAAYVIHDGARLNLTDGYIVPFVSGLGFSELPREASRRNGPGPFYVTDDASYTGASMVACSGWHSEGCSLSYNVSKYVEQWGFYGLDKKTGEPNKVDTTWMTKKLNPALNISAFYLPPVPPKDDWALTRLPSFYGHDWVDPRTNTKPFANVSNIALYIEGTNVTYSLDYVQQHGSCQQQNTYQWGFSFLQVFIMAILLLIWTCGTYLLWHGAHKTLERRRQAELDTEIPSEYKAAITFVSSLHSEMATAGKERPESLTNKELEKVIRADLGGGRILSTTPTNNPPRYSFSRELWRLTKTRWFLFPTTGLMTAYMTTWVLFPVLATVSGGTIFVIFIHTGFVFALTIGRTSRSRGFFAWAGILVMIFFTVILFVITWMVTPRS